MDVQCTHLSIEQKQNKAMKKPFLIRAIKRIWFLTVVDKQIQI